MEVKRLKFALSKLRVQQGKTSKMRLKQALQPTRTCFDDWPACCCLKPAAAVVGTDRKKYQRKKIFSKNRTFRVTFPSFHTKQKKKHFFLRWISYVGQRPSSCFVVTARRWHKHTQISWRLFNFFLSLFET